MFKTINGGKLPTKATKLSAAVDLYANADVVIKAGDACKVPLGVCIDEELLYKTICELGCDFPEHWLQRHYLQLEPRSSLRAKGLIAGTGIIDLDFKDEIMIIIHNPITDVISQEGGNLYYNGVENYHQYKIKKGEKIAQIMLCEHKSVLFGIESDTERIGGFGSSGSK